MSKNIDRVYLKGCWLSVGGNTPWSIKGRITNITLFNTDPRNFNGSDNSFIKIYFDSGYVLEIKTNDYMVVYEERDEG